MSVAITTYKHAPWIGACLDSVLAQVGDVTMEIVVADDCSPDDTGAIVAAYARRYPKLIRVLPRTTNLGYVRNFHDTLRACRGEYVAIFDGDDRMLPGKLLRQVRFLDEHPRHASVTHLTRAFDSRNGRTLRWVRPRIRKQTYTLEDQILLGSFAANSSRMFRRSLLPHAWLEVPVRVVADLPISIGLAEAGPVGYLDTHLADYRVHPSSLMQSSRAWDHVHDREVILAEVERRHPGRFAAALRVQRAYAALMRGVALEGESRHREAAEAYAEALARGYPHRLITLRRWARARLRAELGHG